MLPLRDLAFLADVSPKWVLNTCAALQISAEYSMSLARTLHLTHRLQLALGIPLDRAHALAEEALRSTDPDGRDALAIPVTQAGDLAVHVDLARLDAAFAARRAALATTATPPVRGRPTAAATDPIAAAAAWGIDVSLLRENRRRNATERIRQLDGMAAFRQRVRRTAARPKG